MWVSSLFSLLLGLCRVTVFLDPMLGLDPWPPTRPSIPHFPFSFLFCQYAVSVSACYLHRSTSGDQCLCFALPAGAHSFQLHPTLLIALRLLSLSEYLRSRDGAEDPSPGSGFPVAILIESLLLCLSLACFFQQIQPFFLTQTGLTTVSMIHRVGVSLVGGSLP
ncbi:uncharacterized protein BDZ83DRAFT_596172 [Colletotrichum acutatum]|uniref:Secreted protein n=1 Tax=Glomerella acutata TaxID=27357 RepID=A0AAD8XQI9_GLOAC|nr:uncharacterized protein BDZ83DRAFT_596172 [Colletotrichum acutatum]KAK1731689.1 hypothetical protein BDZ83DRAFT_596172 [Colletotrichum acutatum]